ncbi:MULTISPECIES: sugar phosphate isomerase/epimerase [unclassified Rhizobium]|uniref:sugar phosphate isomerase/epimerase family protein n=1 Tax=unclassified Rhizobium TaxID=2613769 RepID=UPI001FE1463B|nr:MULTISPECIES: sugar phosphate isomerase/epimerase [unclassified Rhizobium]MDF0661686.1 sugar phosphate isomerase/epimerase [Rhizobium sp. BC49]
MSLSNVRESVETMMKYVIALQLYSVRSLGSLEHQMVAASSAGFKAVELLEEHLAEPNVLKTLLNAHELAAPSAHVSHSALRNDLKRLIDVCQYCEIRQLVVPGVAFDASKDNTRDWRFMGSELANLAARLDSAGVTLGYHNMLQDFLPLADGRFGFEVLTDAARGSSLKWQADIAWMSRAGINPADWLKRYRGILVSAHVKDEAPVGTHEDEDGWSDVGDGTIIWPSLWKTATECGASLLVVEHDNPRQPLEFAKRSLSYLSRFKP